MHCARMERTRRGNRGCCIKSCKNTYNNTSSEITFYGLPKAKYKYPQSEKWLQWIQKVNPSSWKLTEYSKICSSHFIGNKSSSNWFSPSYEPTILHRKNNKMLASEKMKVQRFERSMMRRTRANSSVSLNKAVGVENMDVNETIEDDHDSSISCIELPLKMDKGVQAYISDSPNSYFGGETIISCYRDTINNVFHVATQVYVPNNVGSLRIVKKQSTSDKRCGNKIDSIDSKVGSDDSIDYNNILKNSIRFCGFPSLDSDQKMLDFCGVNTATFNLLLKTLSDTDEFETTMANRLLILLTKLKSGSSFSMIGIIFNMHRSTISRIFYSLLRQLRKTCDKFIYWPSRDVIQSTMPDAFKEKYINCRVIIDCTEVKVEKPSTVKGRVQMYSNYKKGYTTKILIGCTPSGAVSFISKCYNGRISDSQITICSGFLDLLEPGDVVMADKGFPGIQTVLNDQGKEVMVVMPPFLNNPQFSAQEVEQTYDIARLRIHIERIIQRFKIYKILDKLNQEFFEYADDIVFVIGVLVNLQSPIIKDKNIENVET